MLLHSRFPLIWYATWSCSAKVKFDRLTLGSGGEGGGGCGQNICYHVTAFMIAFNFICNMTMFWKSWILSFWPPGLGGRGSAGITFATILHVAAPVIPFNLICNITMFWKSLILPLTPPPKSTQGSDTGLRSKVWFDMFLIYCTSVFICYHVAAFTFFLWYATWQCSEKSLILTFWPPGPWGVYGGNICYHVAAFVIPFKLICNVTMFWKS